MGRAVFGLLLGFAIVFGVAFWARTCLPDPNDKGIEWLHREDVIVVQMKQSGGFTTVRLDLEQTPELTLYGDGTVIVLDYAANKLLESHVSDGAIRSLLNYADEKGFFELDYEQPRPPRVDASTTYLYMNTKLVANAVSAYALGDNELEGKEWSQFRQLTKVRSRLVDLSNEVLRGGGTEYKASGIVLVAKPYELVGGPVPPTWPLSDIDLAAIASPSTAPTNQFSGEREAEIEAVVTLGAVFSQNGASYNVGYRPLLPYEENFPEFEPPTQ
jgi:hypothetical protein